MTSTQSEKNRAYYLKYTKPRKGYGDVRGRPKLETPTSVEAINAAQNKRYHARRKKTHPLCHIDRELCELAKRHDIIPTSETRDAILKFAEQMFCESVAVEQL